MTPAELYEIYYLTLGAMDRFFEFWMTASFSVVVAAYFIHKSIDRRILMLIGVVYLLFSVSLAIRYSIATAKFVDVRDQLILQGESLSAAMSYAAGASIVLTFIVGFLGTLGYLYHTYNGK